MGKMTTDWYRARIGATHKHLRVPASAAWLLVEQWVPSNTHKIQCMLNITSGYRATQGAVSVGTVNTVQKNAGYGLTRSAKVRYIHPAFTHADV